MLHMESGKSIKNVIKVLCYVVISCLPFELAAEPLIIELGVQKLYKTAQRIERIAFADPAVAEVSAINDKQLLITPISTGSTSLTIWFQGQQEPQQLILNVVEALHHKQKALSQLDETDITVQSAGSKVLMEGNFSSLEQHDNVKKTLEIDEKGIDRSIGAYPSQVQIDIKIVEISKSRLQTAGFFLGKGLNGGIARVLAPPGGVTSGTFDGGQLTLSGNPIPQGDAFNLVFGRESNGLLAALSLLEGNGFAYTLAEPTLIAMSGQSANFLAGGEFPVPVRGGGIDNSVTVEYKEFGVRLSLTPTVLSEHRIALKVAPEVSELDFNAGIQSGGVTVPALRVRRTDTSVALGDGESFVISGLITQNTVANVNKLPGLGDIPILGAFFRNNRLDREDRELLMIVTPHLVNSLKKNAKLPELPGEKYRNYSPTFSEFWLNENGDFIDKKPATSGFSR
jgi:pilus assembly protein CpaC